MEIKWEDLFLRTGRVAIKAAGRETRVVGGIGVVCIQNLMALLGEVDAFLARHWVERLFQWFGTGGFAKFGHVTSRDVTILVIISLTSRGGCNLRRQEVRSLVGCRKGEGWMHLSRLLLISWWYVLTSSESNLSRKLRVTGLKVFIEFVYNVIADEVLEL